MKTLLNFTLLADDFGPIILHITEVRSPKNKEANAEKKIFKDSSDHALYWLPYTGDYYLTGAGGAFYDAINLSKPIIATLKPHVKLAFEGFCDIGWIWII